MKNTLKSRIPNSKIEKIFMMILAAQVVISDLKCG